MILDYVSHMRMRMKMGWERRLITRFEMVFMTFEYKNLSHL